MARSEYRDLDTDVTLGGSGASDIYVPSQKAVKTYVDNNKGDTLPSQSGQSGKFLTTNGTSASWAEVPSSLAYSAQNPALTPTLGYATWTVTHNLGTSNVICSVYSNGLEIMKDVTITSSNVVTLSIPATSTISANTLTVVVLGVGGSGYDVDSSFSLSSTNPVENQLITKSMFFNAGDTWGFESGSYISSGYLTTSRKEADFPLILPKPINFSSVTSVTINNLECLIRHNVGGYLLSGSTLSWKDIITDTNYSTTYYAMTNNMIYVQLNRNPSTDFGYGANNSPIAVQIRKLSISFT